MNMAKYFFLFFFTSFVLYASTEKISQTIPPVVSVKWLKSHINDPDIVIIDVRKESVFKKGHIKHAINLPTFKYLFDKEYYLPKLSFLKKTFSEAGIDKKSKVVVYGNNQLIWAARFYWISRVLGHKNTALLNVGYGNWKKDELPISKKRYIPKKTDFIPTVDNTILETKLSTLLSIGKKIIIDGRGKDFYNGLKSHAKRYGHIPTALNYPGSLTYDSNSSGSKMKEFDILKKLYKDLPKNKQIILYCEDGADAAINFLVLEKLGYKVSVYDGSWLEWGNDFNLPIENPSEEK